MGAVSCNPSTEDEEIYTMDLTATAWSSGSGSLAINFLINNGISIVNHGHVFIQGTYSWDGKTVKASFTKRIDNYNGQMDEWQESDLTGNPMNLEFGFKLRKGMESAVVAGGGIPGHDDDVILLKVR